MAQVEDVGAVGERVKDSARCRAQSLAPGDQRQRIEIALDRQSGRKLLRRPGRIDRLVDSDRVDTGFIRIGTKLATRTPLEIR